MKIAERIYRLEDLPNRHRWNDMAEDWYLFEDVLEHVFQVKDPVGWLKEIKAKPELWKLISTHLFEFPFEDADSGIVEAKYYITIFRLWEFLFALPQFKAVNCSQRILEKIHQRHEEQEINPVDWNNLMVKLGRHGQLSPETRRAVEVQLMSGRAKATWRRKQEYNAMSGIDRWLYDLTKLTVAQAVQETERREDIPAAIRDTKVRMKNFSQIIKFDLGINF